jgi:hypothetical protein
VEKELAGNWVQEFAFEVALGYFTPEELQLKYNLSPEQYAHVSTLAPFRKAVGDYRREIDDEGIAFRLRARKAAEDILTELHSMAFNQTLDAPHRLKAMEMLCKYAGFETKREDTNQGVKLQIFTNLSLNANTPQQTYTIEIPNDSLQERPTS